MIAALCPSYLRRIRGYILRMTDWNMRRLHCSSETLVETETQVLTSLALPALFSQFFTIHNAGSERKGKESGKFA